MADIEKMVTNFKNIIGMKDKVETDKSDFNVRAEMTGNYVYL